MKSCPQCKFTFPDNVEVCDFDHTELIPIPDTTMALQRSALAKRNSRAARSRVALIMIAIAGVATSALMVGYYDSVNQSGSELAAVPNPESQISAPPHKTPPEKVEPAKLDPATKTRFISAERRIDARHNREGASSGKRTLASSKRSSREQNDTLASATRKSRQSRRINSRADSERADARRSTFDRSKSKVVAVLKKTGSILSKPFRL